MAEEYFRILPDFNYSPDYVQIDDIAASGGEERNSRVQLLVSGSTQLLCGPGFAQIRWSLTR